MEAAGLLRTTTGRIALLTTIVSAVAILLVGLGTASPLIGFIPARISGPLNVVGGVPAALTPLSATLIHGSFLHLFANLLVLVWCGQAVERALGSRGLLILYVVGAYVSAGAQYAIQPHDAAPMVGASGAISALIGAFALSFGQQKKIVSSRRLNRWINVAWLLAAWIAIQLGFGYLMDAQGVLLATPAHIGGFIAGLALQRPLLLSRYRHA